MTDKNNPASPCEFGNSSGKDVEVAGVTIPRKSTLSFGGLTAGEYAAIHLKVPDSGTPWLDEMIEKARRDELVNYLLNPLLNRSDDIYVSPDETFGDALMSLISSYVNGISAASKGDK